MEIIIDINHFDSDIKQKFIEEINRLKCYDYVTISFPKTPKTVKNKILNLLKKRGEDFSIIENHEFKIKLIKLISVDFIKENIKTVLEMINDYQIDGQFLVEKLAKKFNLEIDREMPVNTFAKLKGSTHSWGYVDDWYYFLHGFECQFKQRESEHIVDVILTFKEGYDALDPYFFGNYIMTNPKYKHSNIRIFNCFNDGFKIMQALKELDLLLTIKNKGDFIIGFDGEKPDFIQRAFKGVKLKM